MMKVFAIAFTLLLLIYESSICHAAPGGAYDYLMQYGYASSMSQLVSGATSAKTALRNFQRYAKIPVTGMMDAATKAKLTGPRCGSKDREPTNVARGIPVSFNDMRRRKRYVQQGTTWKKTALTYSVHGNLRPSRKISSYEVRRTLDEAFRMWQAVSPLKFRNVGVNNAKADIIIKFGSGSHGDPFPFDGQSGTLAHGFYPHDNSGLSGDVHFDDDEIWTLNGEIGTTDFLWTSLHEIGHALGLGHSEEKDAIMWPWYEGYKSKFQLRKDDIDGIQSIYDDEPPVIPVVTRRKPPQRKSTICNYDNFDAVMYDKRSRNTYFFKNDKVWTMNKQKIAGNDQRISSKWRGLQGNIDAAYRRPDGYTIFFKGNKYWKYYNFRKIEGPKFLSSYIKNIRTHHRNPKKRVDRIDAAMIWDGNGKTYFFRNKYYWRYNEIRGELDAGYPKPVSSWKNVMMPVQGAMSWKKSKTMFLHRDEIYRFDNTVFKLKIKKIKKKNKISYFIKNCRSRYTG